MRDLYHGTVFDIVEISVLLGKGYKDFGKGFYATSVKSHAENIARRNKRIIEVEERKIRERNSGYRTGIYQAYREWVRFILKNRDSDISVHNYDIVIG